MNTDVKKKSQANEKERIKREKKKHAVNNTKSEFVKCSKIMQPTAIPNRMKRNEIISIVYTENGSTNIAYTHKLQCSLSLLRHTLNLARPSQPVPKNLIKSTIRTKHKTAETANPTQYFLIWSKTLAHLVRIDSGHNNIGQQTIFDFSCSVYTHYASNLVYLQYAVENTANGAIFYLNERFFDWLFIVWYSFIIWLHSINARFIIFRKTPLKADEWFITSIRE